MNYLLDVGRKLVGWEVAAEVGKSLANAVGGTSRLLSDIAMMTRIQFRRITAIANLLSRMRSVRCADSFPRADRYVAESMNFFADQSQRFFHIVIGGSKCIGVDYERGTQDN
jgi:hypothetical protein